MVFYAVILVGYVLLAVVWYLLLCCYRKEIARLQVHDVCCACTYIHTDVYVCMCMCLCAYMCVHVHVIVLSAAFMHLRIYFAVPHCSSRVVNCPGGSMFCC